jgi:two-component system cell cycle response regulator CtrA
MLRNEGHDCHATEMGEEAVALAEQNEYDIIILDVMLPDIDGYEVIRRVRSAGVKTPLLIQSALADRDRKLNGFGFDEYLAKPFNKSQFIARMETVLAQAREGSVSTPIYTQDWERMEWDTSDERRQFRRFMTRKFAFLTKACAA